MHYQQSLKNKWLTLSPLIFISCLLILLLVLSACGGDESSEQNAAAQADPPTAAAEPTQPPSTETAEPTEEPTEEPTLPPTEEPTLTPTMTPTMTAEPSPEPTETPTPTAVPSIVRTYVIQEEGAEARFYIDEVLFGNPKTVIGRTEQVSGEISLDLQDPAAVQISTIQVNSRDLTTDNEFRNRALRTQILDSGQDEFQFITFTPTEISGLDSDPAIAGESYEFEVTGDLQIRDIVQPATFLLNVTAVSENELQGSGEATVLREDFDLRIPSVPGVANVSEEVRLEIDFTAAAEE